MGSGPAHIRPAAQPSASTYQQDPNYACPPGPNGSDYNGGEFFPIVVPPGFTLTNDAAVPGFPTLDLKDQGGVPGNPFIDVKEGILLGQTSALCGGVLQVYNNVLWNNYLGGPSGNPSFPDFNGFPADTNLDYNTVETFPTQTGGPEGYGSDGLSNSQTDPSPDATFHLMTGSQVRDAGDDNKPGIPLEDVDNEDRIKDVVPNTTNDIDLGADERQIP